MPGKVKWLWSINSGSNVDTSNLVTLDGTQTITGAKTLGANLNLSNHKITNLTTPTDNNDAANKTYVDTNKYGDGFVKIYTVANITSSSDTIWTQVLDYTNMESSFSITNGNVYEVLFKENIDSRDVYTSTIIAVNVSTYDNFGITNLMPWGLGNGWDSIQFAISLKGSQFKLWCKRGKSGASGAWNTNTQIYIRKIGIITF